MIVVGLVSHGEPPSSVPQLENLARVVVAVNGHPWPEPTPWRGFGANHNLLMDLHSNAEWYVALNPDVDLSVDELSTLVEQADAHGYSLAGPLRREPWGLRGMADEALPSPSHFFRAALRTRRFERFRDSARAGGASMLDCAWLAGSCIAIRGDLLRELRFDERYFMYFEDTDLCQRARRLGARVGVCTAVTVDHASGWTHRDPLIGRRGVEFARSALSYAEAHGHSQRSMRIALLTWALPRILAPDGSGNARAANRAIAEGLLVSGKAGLSELADSHNRRHSFA